MLVVGISTKSIDIQYSVSFGIKLNQGLAFSESLSRMDFASPVFFNRPLALVEYAHAAP